MSEQPPTDQPTPMKHHASHLRPDGTTFPPVTPDPPPPPGYVDPLAELEDGAGSPPGRAASDDLTTDDAAPYAGGERTAYERTGGGDAEDGA